MAEVLVPSEPAAPPVPTSRVPPIIDVPPAYALFAARSTVPAPVGLIVKPPIPLTAFVKERVFVAPVTVTFVRLLSRETGAEIVCDPALSVIVPEAVPAA